MFETMQVMCLAAPSKIKADASQCMWTEAKDLCSQSPPPKDFVFIILVSLITIILSIPITMALNFLLENYASICPSTEDGSNDIIESKYEGEVVADIESTGNSTEIKEKTTQSDFSKIMKSANGGTWTSGYATTGTAFCTTLLC